MANFAAKVEALQAFFGTPAGKDPQPLEERLASMSAAMGLESTGPLPAQVDALIEATGVSVSSASSGSSSAGAGASAPRDRSEDGTSLRGIGAAPDLKMAKYLAKHKQRETKPIVDERAKQIAALRTLFEGRANGPDRYKHADFLEANEEGNLPTQIAGGLSYSSVQKKASCPCPTCHSSTHATFATADHGRVMCTERWHARD